jgi:hypothetical protein
MASGQGRTLNYHPGLIIKNKKFVAPKFSNNIILLGQG